MSFLYPSFLWALSALAIPIIIHLFNFRKYKTVYFSNLKYLADLQQKSKNESRLKEILILIARCLCILFLVLAFSEPFIPASGNAKTELSKCVSIYIDNSFSTKNLSNDGEVLEIEKIKAKELIKSLNNENKIQIITNDFEGRHQRLYHKQEALKLIDEIEVSAAVKKINQVVKRQQEFLNGSNFDKKEIVLFSDLQKNTFQIQDVKLDSTIQIVVIPELANKTSNLFVDSCWFESPYQQVGFTQKLHAKIHNFNTQKLDLISAKLSINQQQSALASFSIDANASTEIVMSFICKEKGFNYAGLKIEDYPITFDDNLYFSFVASQNIDVCLINGKNNIATTLNKIFKSDSLFNLYECNEQAIDYSKVKSSNLIVLNELNEMSDGLISELKNFSNKGGSILMIPNLETNLETMNKIFAEFNLPKIISNDTSKLKTESIEQMTGFYQGVFERNQEKLNLPVIQKHFKLNQSFNSNFSNIISLTNGDPLFGWTQFNQSKIYLFSTSFKKECSNLASHALLIPTLYKICFGSVRQSNLFYALNSNQFLQINSNINYLETPLKIYSKDSLTEFIPETKNNSNATSIYFQHQPLKPGQFILKYKTTELLPLSFNYSRLESNLESYGIKELQSELEKNNLSAIKIIDYKNSSAGDLKTLMDGGKKLWKLFLLLAIAMLLTEIILLRFLFKS